MKNIRNISETFKKTPNEVEEKERILTEEEIQMVQKELEKLEKEKGPLSTEDVRRVLDELGFENVIIYNEGSE